MTGTCAARAHQVGSLLEIDLEPRLRWCSPPPIAEFNRSLET